VLEALRLSSGYWKGSAPDCLDLRRAASFHLASAEWDLVVQLAD